MSKILEVLLIIVLLLSAYEFLENKQTFETIPNCRGELGITRYHFQGIPVYLPFHCTEVNPPWRP